MTPKKIAFIVIIIMLALFWAWYFFIRLDKKKAIKVILKYDNDANIDTLSGMGDDYLIARAAAYRSAKQTFELDGKVYVTSTGKAK
jgi:hypothetical protein